MLCVARACLEILHKPLKTDPLDFFQTNQSPAHSVILMFLSFPFSKQQPSSLAGICIPPFPTDAVAHGVIPANANPVYSCTKTKLSGASIPKHTLHLSIGTFQKYLKVFMRDYGSLLHDLTCYLLPDSNKSLPVDPEIQHFPSYSKDLMLIC